MQIKDRSMSVKTFLFLVRLKFASFHFMFIQRTLITYVRTLMTIPPNTLVARSHHHLPANSFDIYSFHVQRLTYKGVNKIWQVKTPLYIVYCRINLKSIVTISTEGTVPLRQLNPSDEPVNMTCTSILIFINSMMYLLLSLWHSISVKSPILRWP